MDSYLARRWWIRLVKTESVDLVLYSGMEVGVVNFDWILA
jgi:hypothetical protein